MIPTRHLILVSALALSGCADSRQADAAAKEEADAQLRAEAAKKEMKELPETFRPRHNKKLEPESAPSEPVKAKE